MVKTFSKKLCIFIIIYNDMQQGFYHIYNRGNNKQNIFFNRNNYIFFLDKIKKHVNPHLDILAFCLMPNHFHILAYNQQLENPSFSKDLGIMLRSYTRAINKQENRVGSLFQQNSKVKLMKPEALNPEIKWKNINDDYPLICFHYIHQNPLKSKLVKEFHEWEFSSYLDYAGFRNRSLCNKEMAYDLLGIPKDQKAFMELSNALILF